VYTIDSLVTQLDGDDENWTRAKATPQHGTPTSSSSDPGLMATMLEALDIHDGDAVLEIGTGTGYNAALLSHRLGSRNVTSVEVDPHLAEVARQRLAALDYHPTVVTGDGAHGAAQHAPYDRVIATVAAPTVEPDWIDQTRPGGRILLNPYRELGGGALLLLTVTEPGRAEGHFLPYYGAFMPLRVAQPASSDQQRLRAALHDADGQRTTAELPADIIKHPDAGMLISLLVPHVGWIEFTPEGGTTQLWLLGDDGSWAMHDRHTIEQYGGRRIWDEVSSAYLLWEELGRPSRDRFGMTATAGSTQTLWLDQPGRTVLPQEATG
jgi:protein-L-isoaspartate(D-aspartate) O-methyltransferase